MRALTQQFGPASQNYSAGWCRRDYQLGFTIEEFLAGQLYAHSDVFEKFPELRVVVCHGGGALDRFVPEAGWPSGRRQGPEQEPVFR